LPTPPAAIRRASIPIGLHRSTDAHRRRRLRQCPDQVLAPAKSRTGLGRRPWRALHPFEEERNYGFTSTFERRGGTGGTASGAGRRAPFSWQLDAISPRLYSAGWDTCYRL